MFNSTNHVKKRIACLRGLAAAALISITVTAPLSALAGSGPSKATILKNGMGVHVCAGALYSTRYNMCAGTNAHISSQAYMTAHVTVTGKQWAAFTSTTLNVILYEKEGTGWATLGSAQAPASLSFNTDSLPLPEVFLQCSGSGPTDGTIYRVEVDETGSNGAAVLLGHAAFTVTAA